MHDARAVAHGDVAVADDEVRVDLCRGGRYAGYFCRGFGEERLVGGAFELLAPIFLYYVVFFEELADKRLCEDVVYAFGLNHHILLIGIDAQRHV